MFIVVFVQVTDASFFALLASLVEGLLVVVFQCFKSLFGVHNGVYLVKGIYCTTSICLLILTQIHISTHVVGHSYVIFDLMR
jgi:hypothetical protein